MSAKEKLKALSERLRTSASLYRDRGNVQDRQACYIDVMGSSDEEGAQMALDFLLSQKPEWFPS